MERKRKTIEEVRANSTSRLVEIADKINPLPAPGPVRTYNKDLAERLTALGQPVILLEKKPI